MERPSVIKACHGQLFFTAGVPPTILVFWPRLGWIIGTPQSFKENILFVWLVKLRRELLWKSACSKGNIQKINNLVIERIFGNYYWIRFVLSLIGGKNPLVGNNKEEYIEIFKKVKYNINIESNK